MNENLVQKNSIGIMQGRLTPSRGRGIQFFPFDEWQSEFKKAAKLGLDEIEFIFDYDRYTENPLWTDTGVSEIKRVIVDSGVTVCHVCADFFMRKPFFKNPENVTEGRKILQRLIRNAARVGIKNMDLPILLEALPENRKDEVLLRRFLTPCMEIAKKSGLTISLETNYSPDTFSAFVDSFEDTCIRANYDSGNSIMAGYDCRKEIPSLGVRIANVHIKDGTPGGSTVPLGFGSVDFGALFHELKKIKYFGSLIFQVMRGLDGEEEKTIKEQITFLRRFIDVYMSTKI